MMAKLDLEILAEQLAEKVRPDFERRLARERAEGFKEGVEAAARMLDGTARDAARAPIREYGAKAAAAIRSLARTAQAEDGNEKPVSPKTGHPRGSAPPCACGHLHFADPDGEDAGCQEGGCNCTGWHEPAHTVATSTATAQTGGPGASVALDRDQTHYVGDDCPGGHREESVTCPKHGRCELREDGETYFCPECDRGSP